MSTPTGGRHPLDERSPYGFTWREAIDLFQERSRAKAMVDKFYEDRERKESLRDGRCSICPLPADPEKAKKLCARHAFALKEMRAIKREARKAVEAIEARERRERWETWKAKQREESERKRERRASEALRACYAPGRRRGYVYRLYDGRGRLLYVGKTYRVWSRLYAPGTGHADTKEWFGEAVRATVKVYPNEFAASEAEAWAIKREKPLHNIARPNPKTSRAPRSVLTYSGDLRGADLT